MPDTTLVLGAVAYDAKVVPIGDGFKAWFAARGFAFDYALYSNYERQVDAHFHGDFHVAWNSPRAWLQAVRLARTRLPAMTIAADELLDELERVEETLRQAMRRAGAGCGPDFERRLHAHLRSLRSMLGADDVTVAADTLEAAQRVMISADPAAPLLMLEMARKTLRGIIQREAAGLRLRAAA